MTATLILPQRALTRFNHHQIENVMDEFKRRAAEINAGWELEYDYARAEYRITLKELSGDDFKLPSSTG